jgi:phosphoserine phosphatase
MSLIVTLIGAPGALSESVIAVAMAALQDAGMQPAAPIWLSDAEAADLHLTDGEVGMARRAVEGPMGRIAVDVAVQHDGSRRKRLLVADMDSTIIGQECIDELADAVGLRDAVSAITERAMRGEIGFEGALRERAAMLKGLTPAAMTHVLETRITLTRGATTLVSTMRAHRATTALVSGGFTFFTGRIRERAGFDLDQANELLFDESGNLSGLVREPILGREAKLAALNKLARDRNLSAEETMAVGDGANDLAMIEAAGLGVAFHAKPAVAAQADVRIEHNDLTALLFVQGYRREEFST